MRNLVLNNFNQIFDLSTGFCTVKYWNVYIETNYFALCNDVFTAKYFDENFLITILILMKIILHY